ncbi:MAG: single-stranded-DNA-specific exonuclease RecJ, partial [Tissierellia bacterium]|nr:single-stranded-DNA-specific exonuclease RecJ [Tissierellia bacterium]
MNRNKWKMKEQANEKDVKALMEESGSSEVFASLCVQRGITDLVDLKRMTEPDLSLLHEPFLLFEMEKVVERITEAIMDEQKITIYGDYDADGW